MLPKDKFIKHVRRLLNIEGSSPPVADASSPLDQEVIKYVAAETGPSDDRKARWAHTWQWHRNSAGEPEPCTEPGCKGHREINCEFYDPSRHDPPRCGGWDCSTMSTEGNGGRCEGQLVCECEDKYGRSPAGERIAAWYRADRGKLPFYCPDPPPRAAPFVDINNLPPSAFVVTRADGSQYISYDSWADDSIGNPDNFDSDGNYAPMVD